MYSRIASVINNCCAGFPFSGDCGVTVTWAVSNRLVTLSFTRGDLHFKWYNRHFASSSCKLLRELHFPPCCLLHSESSYIIIFPSMLGISDWMKFIRRLLESPRTSGCVVISEISSHTNDPSGPLCHPVLIV